MQSHSRARVSEVPLFRRRWARVRRLAPASMLGRAFVAPTVAGFWRQWNPPLWLFGLAFVYAPLRRRQAPQWLAVLATFLAVACALTAVAAALLLPARIVSARAALYLPALFTLFGLTTALSRRLERSGRPTPRRPAWSYAGKTPATCWPASAWRSCRFTHCRSARPVRR